MHTLDVYIRVLYVPWDWRLCFPPLNSRVDQSLSKQLLLALLPIAPSIIKLLSLHTQPRLSSIFYHYMLSCTILAATVDGGHLILVKAVEDWLPVCIQVLKDTDNSSSIDTIVLYLSELSSALSYATGVAGVTEKRGLAGEVECLVVDSDPESDDEGAGSGGVVGGDEDSVADESVSYWIVIVVTGGGHSCHCRPGGCGQS